jgi:hypothetical protein
MRERLFVPSKLGRSHETAKATGGQQRRDHMDMGYDHKPLGGETKGRTSQVLGKRKAAAEEQKEQQQDIIVLDDSD